MTTLGKTLKKLRILRKELASIGFKLTIGKSEYLSTRRGAYFPTGSSPSCPTGACHGRT